MSRRAFVVAGVVMVLAACGSAAPKAVDRPGPTTSTTVRSSAGSALTFRAVVGTIPYAGGSESCEGGRRVTPAAKQTPPAQIVLADRSKSACYLLGPTLLSGSNIASADAAVNSTTGTWEVNLRFGNDDFVQKVASVEVNKQVAVVLDGVVQAAPTINPGITGRDVTISGSYDEATARRIAAEIDPSSASRTPATPTTTFIDVFAKRCSAAGVKLGFGPTGATTIVTVAMARASFERAHEPVPAFFANLDGEQRLALCEFTSFVPGATVTPTTVCPNGDHADVGDSPPVILYAVDAHLATVKLPGMQYVLPSGATVPPSPGPCAGLGAP